ncbi:unnamed protein product, partial [Oikopleura dioica]
NLLIIFTINSAVVVFFFSYKFKDFEMTAQENSEAIAIQPSSMAPAQPVVISADGNLNVGLFGCFEDFGLSIKTAFCPCLTYSSTQKELNSKNLVSLVVCGCSLMLASGPPIGSLLGTSLPAAGLTMTQWTNSIYTVGGCCQGVALYEQRKAIRERDNLASMSFTDFLAIVCCQCCALVQHERHTHPDLVMVVPVTAQPQ